MTIGDIDCRLKEGSWLARPMQVSVQRQQVKVWSGRGKPAVLFFHIILFVVSANLQMFSKQDAAFLVVGSRRHGLKE